MSKLPSLGIVVVSYDSSAFLEVCLSSLLADIATYLANVQTVLVENGDKAAQAQTQAQCQTYFEQGVIWRPAPDNLGYGGGANFGWQDLEADVYLVLNPDMKFPVGWLAKLVAPFARDTSIGIVGCKLLNGDGLIQHAGGLVQHDTLLGQHFGANQPDDGRWDESGPVDFVTGAALAMRREVYHQTGGFDPAYFPGYYEDVDLCHRARQYGWQVWYESNAVAHHFEGGSFGRKATYYASYHRNRYRFALKSLSTQQLLNDFLPAEKARLQTAPPGSLDLQTSASVYREAVTKTLGEDMPVLPDEKNNPVNRLPDHLAEVKQGWLVKEQPFRSRLPFVAKLRERINNLSTRWYVQPILAQQVEYNAAVARAVEDLGQLAASSEAVQNMQVATLADRMTKLETRLERIEQLLEKLTYEPNKP